MAVRDKRLKRKLDRARRLLGTRTDEETVERALDALLAEERIVRALRRARAAGGFEDVFGRS
jgi:hypothetical protein